MRYSTYFSHDGCDTLTVQVACSDDTQYCTIYQLYPVRDDLVSVYKKNSCAKLIKMKVLI